MIENTLNSVGKKFTIHSIIFYDDNVNMFGDDFTIFHFQFPDIFKFPKHMFCIFKSYIEMTEYIFSHSTLSYHRYKGYDYEFDLYQNRLMRHAERKLRESLYGWNFDSLYGDYYERKHL